MTANPPLHRRRSIRLKGYDYSQAGAYFITICTHNRASLFGEIVNGEMRLNELGQMVNFTWFDLVNHVKNIELGPFVIMPNHIHGIVHIIGGTEFESVGAGSEPAPTEPVHSDPIPNVRAELKTVHSDPVHSDPTPNGRAGSEPAPTALPEIVRQFKTFSARRVNDLRQTPGIPVWQRNYYEHIIRDERDYLAIAQYVLNNPLRWELDSIYPGKDP